MMKSTVFNTTRHTQRLRLEPFAPQHAPMLNAINNEPEVMRFLSRNTHESLSQTQEAIQRVGDRWERLRMGWWAIIEQPTQNIIGAACLQTVANAPDAELEIGWRLATAAWGKGYATEAGQAAIDYAFNVIGADHVVAVADQQNTASHNVMRRLGMTYRGLETHYDSPCTTYVRKKYRP